MSVDREEYVNISMRVKVDIGNQQPQAMAFAYPYEEGQAIERFKPVMGNGFMASGRRAC